MMKRIGMPETTNTEDKVFNNTPSPFVCIACHHGYMQPIIEEGDAVYTEHYVCLNCGKHDTIPSVSIIFSQFFTALLGLAISIYLLLTNFALLSGIQSNTTSSLNFIVQEATLSTIALVFLAAFLYVMYQSLKGMLLRKSYLRTSYSPA